MTKCELTEREFVETVACPPEFIGTVARVVAPSLNAILPVGVPAPGAATFTVAVNVTVLPRIDGFADELSTVVVAAGFTVCDRVPVLA